VLEQAAVEAFAERVLGDYAGANAFFMAGIGDRLGLFKELAANGAATSDELATRTRLQERYVREWLAGMAAAGYLDYDPATGRYALPADHVPVLAEEAGPFFFGSAFFDFSTNFGETYRRLVDAFRDGGGVPQSEYGAEVAESIERFTAPWFEHMLVQQWLPLMPDTLAKLEEGAIVCDVGCGRGRALSKLAAAFPRSRFIGYDVYEPAIQAARARVQDAGVADRVRLEVRDAAQGFGERFDVVTTFDVLHDSVDPRGDPVRHPLDAVLEPPLGRLEVALAAFHGTRTERSSGGSLVDARRGLQTFSPNSRTFLPCHRRGHYACAAGSRSSSLLLAGGEVARGLSS
jgi:hypothetical protein